MKQLIKRDRHLQRLIDKKENGLIKVITGIRRCGKSKLLFELYYDWLLRNGINNNHIITIALDTVEGRIYRDPDIMYGYPNKYYCVDIGLRNARLKFRQQEETHIMENVIFNELLYRGYSVDIGIVDIVETIDGKRTKKQCEIDFVVNKGSKKYYIQSALSISDPKKSETELRPLKATHDFFKKIIVTKTSAKPWTDEDGILHIGLYEFLLNQNSLEL